MEVRCTRDLALKLGAISPKDNIEHKNFKNQGMMLFRDQHMLPLFMPWQLSKLDIAVEITPRST